MSQDKVILATTEVIDGVMLTRESLGVNKIWQNVKGGESDHGRT